MIEIRARTRFSLRDLVFAFTVATLHLATYVGLYRVTDAAHRGELIVLTVVFAVLVLLLLAHLGKWAAASIGNVQISLTSSIPWRPVLSLAIAVSVGGYLVTYYPRFVDSFLLAFVFVAAGTMKLILGSRVLIGEKGVVLPFYGCCSWEDTEVILRKKNHEAQLQITCHGSKRRLIARIPVHCLQQIESKLYELMRARKGESVDQQRDQQRRQNDF